MSDAALAVQTAVLTELVSALSEPVYDHVPEDTNFPYVTIGDDSQEDWSADGLEGEIHVLTIHSWSRYRGRKQIKEIMDSVKDALHEQSLTLMGHDLISMRWESSETILEDDGITYHGTQKFRALTQETSP